MTNQDAADILQDLLQEVGVRITPAQALQVAPRMIDAEKYENQGQEVGYAEKPDPNKEALIRKLTYERDIYQKFIENALRAKVYIDEDGKITKY